MDKLKVMKKELGPLPTNVYLGIHKDTGECFLVDPADKADAIGAWILGLGGKLTAILLTHGHGDHIGAVNALRERFSVPVFAAEAELPLLSSPALNLSGQLGRSCAVAADRLLKGGERFREAGISFLVLATPGHTAGGLCYYLPEEKILFSGDTLFRGAVGRTDLPTGNGPALAASIRRELMPLPDDVLVLPGHEEATAIGLERRDNPWFRG